MMSRRALTLKITLLALIACSLSAGGQATTFRGLLIITADGIKPGQVRVTLVNYGSDVARSDGSFAIPIPSGVTTVELMADVNGRRLHVTSPRNPINVPLSSTAITEVFIGPSFEQFLADALGPVRAKLESTGRAAGARDSTILNALRDLTSKFAEMASVREDVLSAEAARAQKRSEVFPQIARMVDRFEVEANNFHQVFQYVANAAFSNDSAFALIKRTINNYNPAADSLLINQGALKQLVKDNWGEQQATVLQSVLDLALGDIHDVLIYPMNRTLPKIDSVLKRRVGGTAANRIRTEVLWDSNQFVIAVAPKLALLRERKARLMTDLQSR